MLPPNSAVVFPPRTVVNLETALVLKDEGPMAGQSFASIPHAGEPLTRMPNKPSACPSLVEGSELLASPPQPEVDEPIVSAPQPEVLKAEPSGSGSNAEPSGRGPKLNEAFKLAGSPIAGCCDTGGCGQNTAK